MSTEKEARRTLGEELFEREYLFCLLNEKE
jgi:hypothetical protein